MKPVSDMTPQDLAGGSYLTANVWNGTTGAKVEVSIDGGAKAPAQRTQQARGEEYRVGAEWADPYAATRQLSVNRYAQQSTSGDPRSQGYELYRGSKYGPGAARPGNNIADRMSHLWRLPLPANLSVGVHRAEVTATDRLGRRFTETISFEVVEKRPQMEFRKELFTTGG